MPVLFNAVSVPAVAQRLLAFKAQQAGSTDFVVAYNKIFYCSGT